MRALLAHLVAARWSADEARSWGGFHLGVPRKHESSKIF